jgi:hypothetical protein
MTTCPKCGSIWIRALAKWIPSQDASESQTPHWHRNYHCGGCGGLFTYTAAWVSQGPTDMEMTKTRHDIANGLATK